LVERLVEGTTQTAGSTVVSYDAREFVQNTPLAASLTAQFVANTSLTGSAAIPGQSPLGFSLSYAPAYGVPAQQTAVAGSWLAPLTGGRSVLLVLTGPNGMFSGSTSDGCTFTGSLIPRSSGKNVYDARFAFGGAPCALAGRSTMGIAVWDPGAASSQVRLLIASTTDERSGGFTAQFQRMSNSVFPRTAVTCWIGGMSPGGAQFSDSIEGQGIGVSFSNGLRPPTGSATVRFRHFSVARHQHNGMRSTFTWTDSYPTFSEVTYVDVENGVLISVSQRTGGQWVDCKPAPSGAR
jgi:hypothetical protein